MVYVIVMDYASGKVNIHPNVQEREDYDEFVSSEGYREQDCYYMVVEKLDINYR
jgi:hypothetical protein